MWLSTHDCSICSHFCSLLARDLTCVDYWWWHVGKSSLIHRINGYDAKWHAHSDGNWWSISFCLFSDTFFDVLCNPSLSLSLSFFLSQVNPLMGWTSARDTAQQLREMLWFTTEKQAIDFAEREGFHWTILPHHAKKLKAKAFADNFKWSGQHSWCVGDMMIDTAWLVLIFIARCCCYRSIGRASQRLLNNFSPRLISYPTLLPIISLSTNSSFFPWCIFMLHIRYDNAYSQAVS